MCIRDRRYTVADLVDSEKRFCDTAEDMSWTLLGLSYYLDEDATWQSASGRTWSLKRIVEHELRRRVSQADCDTTNRLMGLSWAIHRRTHRKAPLDGPYCEAQKHLADCHEFALRIQNADGSWHPSFFALRGTSRDALGSLRATAYILDWLAFSLPEKQLRQPEVINAAQYVAATLESWQGRTYVPSLASREIDSVMRGLHALSIYSQRVSRPVASAQPADRRGTTAPQ